MRLAEFHGLQKVWLSLDLSRVASYEKKGACAMHCSLLIPLSIGKLLTHQVGNTSPRQIKARLFCDMSTPCLGEYWISVSGAAIPPATNPQKSPFAETVRLRIVESTSIWILRSTPAQVLAARQLIMSLAAQRP